MSCHEWTLGDDAMVLDDCALATMMSNIDYMNQKLYDGTEPS